MKIVFRVDSSKKIGAGHLSRCITLAEELINRGASVQFICREHEGNLIALLQNRDIATVVLPMITNADDNNGLYHEWLGATEKQDSQETLSVIGETSPDWLIIDHYSISRKWQVKIKEQVKNILVIDDLIDKPQYCDALLNQNFIIDGKFKYKDLVAESCDLLLGTDYSLLKPGYLATRNTLKERNNSVERVLIFFTAGDDAGETLKAMQGVNQCENVHYVDVVVGLNNQYKIEIENYCAEKNWFYHCQIDYMYDLIAEADLVIGACGASTWERCALGAATVCVIMAENQRKVAEELQNKEVLHCLGWFESVTAETYYQAINTMCITELKKMSKNSLQLVDAKGASRVANYLLSKKDKKLS
jgi:UDP-2,4-diacetamido-2,4,6-trideoxy-beta-L-altropyranose hydrolase